MSENYEANNQDLEEWWASLEKTSAGTWSYFLNNIVGTRRSGEREWAAPTSPDIPQDPLMNEFAFLRNAGGQAYGGDSAQGYGESVPEELSPMALHEINMRDPKYALDHTKRNFGNGVWRTQAEWDALPESYRLQYETPASPETPPELTHDEIMDRISKHTSKMMQEQRACEEAGRKWSISGNYCAPAGARAIAL